MAGDRRIVKVECSIALRGAVRPYAGNVEIRTHWHTFDAQGRRPAERREHHFHQVESPEAAAAEALQLFRAEVVGLLGGIDAALAEVQAAAG